MADKRTYPFGEWKSGANTTAGNTGKVDIKWWVVTVQPNPFKGWRRAVFAFDEWAHRHNLNSRGPLRWLCTWWDRQLGAPRG